MSKVIKISGIKYLYVSLLLVLFCANISIAQEATTEEEEVKKEKTKPLSFSGSVDAYFRGNLTSKNSSPSNDIPATSFANLPGFALGMANLVTTIEGEKAGFVADIVIGPRGTEAVFNSVGSPNIVNQMYAYWNATDNFTLTIGNFNTFLGYEVISPSANFNYSTSYMFSYGPFSHTGLKADIGLGDDASLMLAVMNPTDFTEFNPSGGYSYGAQFGFKGVYLNFLYGDQDGKLDDKIAVAGDVSAGGTFQADLTAGFDLSDAIFLGINATYNTTGVGEIYDGTTIVDVTGDGSGFAGTAVYFQVATSEALSLGVRGEYFSEFNGGVGALITDINGDGNIIDLTLSANYKIGDLIFIPELRIDLASEDTFTDRNLSPTKNLASFLLAAVYTF